MNNNLFKLKKKDGIKWIFYAEKHHISKSLLSQYFTRGVSLNSVIRYDLWDLIDTEQFPEWYYKMKEMEEK